eukprot:2096821-Rhodomonas_salina.2
MDAIPFQILSLRSAHDYFHVSRKQQNSHQTSGGVPSAVQPYKIKPRTTMGDRDPCWFQGGGGRMTRTAVPNVLSVSPFLDPPPVCAPFAYPAVPASLSAKNLSDTTELSAFKKQTGAAAMADRQRHSVARLEGKSRSSMRPTERDEEADAGYKRRRTEIRPPQVGTFEIGEISTTLALLTCPHLERHGTHEKRHEEPETKKSRRTTTGAHHTVSSPAAAKSSKDKRREVVREEHVAASPAAAKSSKMKRRETRDEVEREQPSPSPRAAKSFRSSKQDRREAEEAGSKSTAAEGKSKAEGKKPLPKDKGKAPALAAAAGARLGSSPACFWRVSRMEKGRAEAMGIVFLHFSRENGQSNDGKKRVITKRQQRAQHTQDNEHCTGMRHAREQRALRRD